MKIVLRNIRHRPSEALVELLHKELKSLQGDLPFREARVCLERRPDREEQFRVSFHLVAPGPDVIVASSGETLRSAMFRALAAVNSRIGRREGSRTAGGDTGKPG